MIGRAWKFGNDVNTDEIIPARYLNTSDPAELAAHCMEDACAQFAAKVKPGDVIVAGDNFGCGSSREHAPISIKTAGVSCVVAGAFARIFLRNSINIGLPIIEHPDAAHDILEGDEVELDLEGASLVNHTQGRSYPIPPFPDEIRKIISAGGLMNYLKTLVAAGNA